MQALLAIAFLTLKSAFRSRLIIVLGLFLLTAVILLPLVVRDDGSARGFTQIILTYTLSLTTAVLGLATLWMGCGTLARDIEECQIQMVAVKPVARWRIWLGKWLGLMMMNALLLAMAGGSIFALMQWRAKKLPEDVREVLQNEVLVARGSAREPTPDFEAEVARRLQERLVDTRVAEMDIEFVQNQIREQLRGQKQVVPGGYARTWRVPLGPIHRLLTDEPLFLRIKFYSPPEDQSTLEPKTYVSSWIIGPPESPEHRRMTTKHSAETFHEFAIPENLFDDEGILTVSFLNQNESALLFRVEDGLEVLYRTGGFGLNFARGIGIIFCWMGLLGALGLMASSFLSFPVAAFFCLAMLMLAFSTGILTSVVEQGTLVASSHEHGSEGVNLVRWLDPVLVPLFSFVLQLINQVRQFSPIDMLSSGRSITWLMLLKAATSVVLLLGGILAAMGMSILTRRELASTQTQG